VARLALIAAVLSVLLVACDDEVKGGPVDGPGYTAELPDGWKDAGTGGSVGETIEDETSADVKSVWIRDHRDSGFQANVNVTFEDVPAGSDPVAVATQSLRGLGGSGVPAGLDRAINVTPLTKPAATTLGDEPAAMFDYLNEIPAAKVHQRTVVAIRGLRAVFVTASALDSAFDEREPELQQILDSWEWAPKK
jgi:hypothetical protein